MSDEYEATIDGEAADREPDGPASRLYHDPDPEFDYSDGVATDMGEPCRAELRLERLDGTDVKRYLLEEPTDDRVMSQAVRAALNQDRLAFVQCVVSRMTEQRWNEDHTPRERALLYDHTYSWMQMSDFVTISESLG